MACGSRPSRRHCAVRPWKQAWEIITWLATMEEATEIELLTANAKDNALELELFSMLLGR